MAEKDSVFSSKIKYGGIFSFSDFYKFCHDWLSEEMGLDVSESKYAEKLKGDSKDIDVEWKGSTTVTDYFKFEVKVKFTVKGLKKVELNKSGTKIKTNDGSVELSAKGTLVKDYDGKFEKSGFQKFLRGIYQKWVIGESIGAYEDKLAGGLDEFLAQAKSYLALEGKK